MSKLRIQARFTIIAIITVVLSVGISSGVVLSIMKADLEQQAKAFQDTKLKVFHQLLDHKGKPRLEGDNMVFGEYIANNNFEVVDKLKEIAGGTATIFMGDMRIATNVMKADGSRAVGTTLQGTARDVVLGKGMPYRGEADILGVPYFTAYDPLLDSNGRPIGVLYVGLRKDEFLRSLQTSYMAIGAVGALLTLVFVGLILFFVRGMLREIVRLTKSAEEVSMGNELNTPIQCDRKDEIGELARAIERLRKSIKSALDRLT